MKLATRNLNSPHLNRQSLPIRHSDFGFDSSFGFRISGFRTSGFTLVELMISLILVLILILGINYVFRSAADAVGAGQATNQINADAQSSQPMLFDDLRNASKNPPCFIIASQLVTQFQNTDDAKGGSDPNFIAIDNAGNYAYIGTKPAQPSYTTVLPTQWISAALLNSRNHRCDLLKFFAHALYQRRSGPDGTYYSADSSNDAFIEFGHAALPASDLSAFYGPSPLPLGNAGYSSYNGTTSIPGVPRIGGYAADWVLTRRLTLLKDPNEIPPWPKNPPSPPSLTGNTTDPFYTPAGTPLQYAAPGAAQTAFAVNMAPLSYGTPDTNGGATQFQSSRYDLAGTTPEEFDRVIANAILPWQAAGYTGQSLWWNPLVYTVQFTQGTGTPPAYYALAGGPSNPNGAIPPYIVPYNNAFPHYGFTYPGDPGLLYARPQCNPTIQNPVSSASIAEMAPYFLQHCSQFIVEYAGDYMQQDANGNMIGLGPDGQIDYYLDANGNKHIRWYGMPRSSTGALHDDGQGHQVLIRGLDITPATPDTIAEKTDGSPTGPMSFMLNYFTDVIPLRDYYSLWFASNPPATLGIGGAFAPPWEVDINFDPTRDYGGANGNTPFGGVPYNNAFNTPGFPPRYVAAWHDDMPAMIRILIKVDDPNNKVKDGPWYEYVFRLK